MSDTGIRSSQSGSFLFVLAATLLAGCTNMLSTGSGLNSAANGNYVLPSSSSGANAVGLSTVVRDTLYPTEFVLVGDGSGQLGNLCTNPASAASGGGDGSDGSGGAAPAGSASGSTCSCNYSYIRSDGSTETFDVPTTYVEPNLIRCSFSSVARSAPYVNVRIHLTNSDAYSNTIKYRFAGTGQFLDLTDPKSFVTPFRYQCRDSIAIPMTWGVTQPDKTVYDPFLSEDPSIAFSKNYYASNMYDAVNAFLADARNNQQTPGRGSICPANPNDPTFGTDLALYSLGPDSNGSRRIFPPTGSSFDRSTFYLARQPSGVFNVPVNSFIAPNTITQVPQDNSLITTVPERPIPIGYGAAPTPLDNGTETCPDSSVQIPAGFKWVKVFQFRASLNPRMRPKSPQLSRTAISCNPGFYIDPNPGASSTPTMVVPACTGGLVAAPNDQVLADRAIYGAPNGGGLTDSKACMMMSHPSPQQAATICNDPTNGPGSSAGCTATSSGVQKGAFSLWPTASDIWTFRNTNYPSTLCASGAPEDTLHLCNNAPIPVPYDDQVSLDPLDPSSIFDFVMVVTPTTVHYRQMNDPSNSSTLPYVPYRFYPGKCTSGDPQAPAFAGDCAISNRINYAIKNHDVNTNGDEAPSTGNGRLPVFPVCALQPI